MLVRLEAGNQPGDPEVAVAVAGPDSMVQTYLFPQYAQVLGCRLLTYADMATHILPIKP